MISRERRVLVATSLLAAAVPLAAQRLLSARVDGGLAPALSALTGQPVTVGGVDAGLTGTVRLTGLVVGDLIRADAIEAWFSPGSLLRGGLRADEIRVSRPELRARVDGAGGSELARVIQRVAQRRRARPAAGSRAGTRIVVTEGALVIDVVDRVGHGRLEARGVEVQPLGGDDIRIVTGPVTATGRVGAFAVDARFGRAGVEASLGEARIGRAIAVGGTVSLTVAPIDRSGRGVPLVVRGAVLGHALAVPGSDAVSLRGELDDDGVPRPIVMAASTRGLHIESVAVPLAALSPLVPRGLELDGAHAGGALTLLRADHGVDVIGHGRIEGATIDHAAVAAAPVAVDVTAAIDLGVTDDGIALRDVQVSRAGLTLMGHGTLHRGAVGAPATFDRGALSVAIDATGCQAVLDALPPTLRGSLAGLTVAGDLSGHVDLAFDLGKPVGQGVVLDSVADLGCEVVADAPGADPRRLADASEHVFPDGSRAMVGLGVGDWVRLADLPSAVPAAFVASEDARFFSHHGFDLGQIARSLEVDLREGRFVRGGSTISQQLVKNAFLSLRRSLDRKLQEAVLTWRIEATLDKKTILERYLNVIELGPGVHGVAAAARHWFDKPARALTVKEAAFLVALTPEPTTMSRRLAEARGLDPISAARVEAVLRAMQRDHVISAGEAAAARSASLALRSGALQLARR